MDTIAEQWAIDHGIWVDAYPADWDNPAYRTPTGKSFAGNMRNQQMLDEGKPDLVIAFHRDFPNSRGTKDMVKRARRAGIPVEIYPEVKTVTPETLRDAMSIVDSLRGYSADKRAQIIFQRIRDDSR